VAYDRFEVTVRKTENSIKQYATTGRRSHIKKEFLQRVLKELNLLREKKETSMMVIIMKLEERRRQTEKEDILYLRDKKINK
jgi:hypothetical protein